MLGAALGVALGAALVAGAVLVPAPPASAEAVDCLQVDPEAVEPAETRDPSLPLVALGVPALHEHLARAGVVPGAGVAVAVVDSGVSPRVGPSIRVTARRRLSQQGEVVDQHGTAVAGLIAGAPRAAGLPVGVAPGAGIVDVKVYDSRAPDEDTEDPVESANVAAGLAWVAENARDLGIGVVNVSLAMDADERLERAVRRLVAADVVVVAASGNRPTDPADPLYDDFGPQVDEAGEEVERRPGEDARGRVFPAAYPGVVAVSSTADGSGEPDATALILQNSDVDVAAPSFGAVSYGVDGGTCGLPLFATSWSTALVSGVVAVLRSAYPDETAEQIVARLVTTASGTPGVRTVLTGAGVVQPLEALVRPLDPDRQGRVERVRPEDGGTVRATAPAREADLLADTREQVVWWGLLGGGALLLALVLRPVLARRR